MEDKKMLQEFYNFASLFCKDDPRREILAVLNIGANNLLATNGRIALISKNKPEVFKDELNSTVYWKELNRYLLTNQAINFNTESNKENTQNIIKSAVGWINPKYEAITKNTIDINIEFKDGFSKLTCEDITWYLNTGSLTYALRLCNKVTIAKNPHDFTLFECEQFFIVIMPLRGLDDTSSMSHEFSKISLSRIDVLKEQLYQLRSEVKRVSLSIDNIRVELDYE